MTMEEIVFSKLGKGQTIAKLVELTARKNGAVRAALKRLTAVDKVEFKSIWNGESNVNLYTKKGGAHVNLNENNYNQLLTQKW